MSTNQPLEAFEELVSATIDECVPCTTRAEFWGNDKLKPDLMVAAQAYADEAATAARDEALDDVKNHIAQGNSHE